MAISSTLDALIELAALNCDEAAERLRSAMLATDQAQQKLALLQQYRDEYAARLQAGMAAGLTAWGYRNYQLFLEKLDQAIAGQQHLVQNTENRMSKERQAWQDSERTRKSYGMLADRAQEKVLRQQTKREQKSSDEHATRQIFYKR